MNKNNIIYRMIPFYIIVIIIFTIASTAVNSAVTVLSQNATVTSRKVVIIDAGHGGIDGGATSCDGVPESRINLDIAICLRDMCHLLGIKTVMIRTEDISVYKTGNTISEQKISDLKHRAEIVNACSNCLLISIHQNYFSDGKYSGPQVFYSEAGEGSQIGNMMQSALITNLNPECNRKAKKADGIYLMQHIYNTGILIECGFISNAKESQLLQNKSYQQMLCGVIATVADQYLNT